jgi:Plasmid pRiA4b ORF-3-like protein
VEEGIGCELDVTTGTVHQLKVTLVETEPAIWRRVQVRSETTLAELHRVLQVAMGWEDVHLHAFGAGGGHDGEWEARTRLDEAAGHGGGLTYVYDFGDHWEHEVVVEKVIVRPRPGTFYPRCTGGRWTCPPEDSGGPPGFSTLLRALRHRKGLRYREAREFLGGGRFDVDALDLEAVNRELARLSAEPVPGITCLHCRSPIEIRGRGRPRLYCSEPCRHRAWRRRRQDMPVDLARPAEGYRLDGSRQRRPGGRREL